MAEPNFQPAPISVTLARGTPWRSGYPPWELCNMLNALEQTDIRILKAGAIKKMRLDARSRATEDNRLNLSRDKKRRIATARKINKGLAMEMVMSSLLTFVDNPSEVVSRCVASRSGKPNNFAQGDAPDIVFRPAKADPAFQVVFEVSANQEMDDETYAGQLERGLEHAWTEHREAGVNVTYLFVVNLRKIGEEPALQKIVQDFLTESKHGLAQLGPIRPVAMRAAEFATAVRRLHHEDRLSFSSRVLAEALDALHARLWEESLPGTEDWMTEIFVEKVRQAYRIETVPLEPGT